jgi:hypothetical protein
VNIYANAAKESEGQGCELAGADEARGTRRGLLRGKKGKQGCAHNARKRATRFRQARVLSLNKHHYAIMQVQSTTAQGGGGLGRREGWVREECGEPPKKPPAPKQADKNSHHPTLTRATTPAPSKPPRDYHVPRVSADIITPPLYLTASTEVPVTMGAVVRLEGPNMAWGVFWNWPKK